MITDKEAMMAFKSSLIDMLKDGQKLFKIRKQVALNLIKADKKRNILTDKERKLCQYYL